MSPKLHKNKSPEKPKLSIILLDWSCRERFTALDWLNKQDIAKCEYELIWVELFSRVIPEVIEKADVVITCNQSKVYHKHVGYNVGLLQARGELICVCDSDAVFPMDFVRSILKSFGIEKDRFSKSHQVLMHYEWRTSQTYPDGISDAEILKDKERWEWWPLIVNEGACVSFRREDAIRFGGFDEHPSYSGYLCGPYDLAWRLVNAGWHEIWHDSSVALWHFAHPDPIGSNGQKASLKQLLEKAYPHLEGHALTAVEAFSTGRFQPLKENPKIWALRMSDRRIGSKLEVYYSSRTGQAGFSAWAVCNLWFNLYLEIFIQYFSNNLLRLARLILGEWLYSNLKDFYHNSWTVKKIRYERTEFAMQPVLLCSYKGYNLIKLREKYYAARRGLSLDLTTNEGISDPELLVSDNYYSLLKMVREKAWKQRLKRINRLLVKK